jgi:hypothetical protein
MCLQGAKPKYLGRRLGRDVIAIRSLWQKPCFNDGGEVDM